MGVNAWLSGTLAVQLKQIIRRPPAYRPPRSARDAAAASSRQDSPDRLTTTHRNHLLHRLNHRHQYQHPSHHDRRGYHHRRRLEYHTADAFVPSPPLVLPAFFSSPPPPPRRNFLERFSTCPANPERCSARRSPSILSERMTSRHLSCGGDGGRDDGFADGFMNAISSGLGVGNGGGISGRVRPGLKEVNSPPTGVRLSARDTDSGAPGGFPGTPGPLSRAGRGGGEGNGVARRNLRPSSTLAPLEALRSPFEATGGGEGGGGVSKGTGGERVRSGGVMASLLRPLLDALDDARGVRATGAAAMKVKRLFGLETRSAMPPTGAHIVTKVITIHQREFRARAKHEPPRCG